MRSNHTNISGFTLIELLVTIAIIGVLFTVATPAYTSYIQQGKVTEALATLSSLSVQMEKSYLDSVKREYGTNKKCAVKDPSQRNFSYSCKTTDGQDYIWTAEVADKYTFTIDNDGNKTSQFGKGNKKLCWVASINKGCD